MGPIFRKIRQCTGNSSGATLIELMVSLIVFSIGVLAITAMCIMSIQSNDLINRMTQANLLAQAKMEELLDSDAGSLVSSTDTVGNYAREWVIVDHGDPDGKWMTVTVTWTDSKGDHDMAITSFLRD